MVVLKTIKGSTLMETMVATVLIIVLFMMTSMLLNSIFSSSTSSANNQLVTAHLNKLEYGYRNGAIRLPHFEQLEEWDIELRAENFGTAGYLLLEATNTNTKKQIKTYSTIAE